MNTERELWFLSDGSIMENVHPRSQCEGRGYCMIHEPSEHHMRNWPVMQRSSGLSERVCSCGVGHPDPDSARYMNERYGGGYDVHGCCAKRCCSV